MKRDLVLIGMPVPGAVHQAVRLVLLVFLQSPQRPRIQLAIFPAGETAPSFRQSPAFRACGRFPASVRAGFERTARWKEWGFRSGTTIPSNVPFFQNLRELMPEICHKRGMLAIGGMTALFPSREDSELNTRALGALQKDKKNKADCLMDAPGQGIPIRTRSRLTSFHFPTSLQSGGRRRSVIRTCGRYRKELGSTLWPGHGQRCGQ